MTKEEVENNRAIYIDVIKQAVKETVNGKIDKITEKLDLHIQETREYIKEDTTWKSTADPYIKLAANISGVWKFLIYCCTGITAFIAVYVGISKLK